MRSGKAILTLVSVGEQPHFQQIKHSHHFDGTSFLGWAINPYSKKKIFVLKSQLSSCELWHFLCIRTCLFDWQLSQSLICSVVKCVSCSSPAAATRSCIRTFKVVLLRSTAPQNKYKYCCLVSARGCDMSMHLQDHNYFWYFVLFHVVIF